MPSKLDIKREFESKLEEQVERFKSIYRKYNRDHSLVDFSVTGKDFYIRNIPFISEKVIELQDLLRDFVKTLIIKEDIFIELTSYDFDEFNQLLDYSILDIYDLLKYHDIFYDIYISLYSHCYFCYLNTELQKQVNLLQRDKTTNKIVSFKRKN